MATHGEEGRGKLRKASGSRKQALIRRYPNGETRLNESSVAAGRIKYASKSDTC